MNPKKLLGFKKKPRASEEINKDYNLNAVQIGHKRVLQAELYEEAERLENEISAHVQAMRKARLEARHAPRAEEKPAESQPQEQSEVAKLKGSQ